MTASEPKCFTPTEAMIAAIAEAEKGAGFVSPNPLVGCAILNKNSELIALGHHARVGGAHAEADALAKVRDPSQLQGAHVIVTLEPCAHVGRTPSCAQTLARLPIAKVTYGVGDPNPLVNGKGIAILRAAGIETEQFEGLKTELTELCEIFLCNIQEKRPFVALKTASTLDGKVAMLDGTSQWITGESARAHVQYLRGCYDAVLAGINTLKRDDPRLNARDIRFGHRRQRVVILDPQGESFSFLKTSKLISVRPAEDILVITAGKKPVSETNLRVVTLPLSNGSFEMQLLLSALMAEGIHSVFVEGGARTYGEFLRAGVADRLYLFLAPKVLGEGMSWPLGHSAVSLQSAFRLESMRIKEFTPDILLTGRILLSQSNH